MTLYGNFLRRMPTHGIGPRLPARHGFRAGGRPRLGANAEGLSCHLPQDVPMPAYPSFVRLSRPCSSLKPPRPAKVQLQPNPGAIRTGGQGPPFDMVKGCGWVWSVPIGPVVSGISQHYDFLVDA